MVWPIIDAFFRFLSMEKPVASKVTGIRPITKCRFSYFHPATLILLFGLLGMPGVLSGQTTSGVVSVQSRGCPGCSDTRCSHHVG